MAAAIGLMILPGFAASCVSKSESRLLMTPRFPQGEMCQENTFFRAAVDVSVVFSAVLTVSSAFDTTDLAWPTFIASALALASVIFALRLRGRNIRVRSGPAPFVRSDGHVPLTMLARSAPVAA
jgi:hypothetical protein